MCPLSRMVVVLGSFILLGTQLRSTLFVAVLMVTASLYLYNVPAASSTSTSSPAPVALKDFDKVRGDEDEPKPLLEDREQRV